MRRRYPGQDGDMASVGKGEEKLESAAISVCQWQEGNNPVTRIQRHVRLCVAYVCSEAPVRYHHTLGEARCTRGIAQNCHFLIVYTGKFNIIRTECRVCL